MKRSQVPLRPIAERLERGLIARAVVHGDRLLHALELDHHHALRDLIPLGIGALPVRDRQKRLQAKTRGSRLRFIHAGIISSFDKGGLAMSARGRGRPSDKVAIHTQRLALPTGFGTVVSFPSGVRAKIRNGQVGHRCSVDLMLWQAVSKGPLV